MFNNTLYCNIVELCRIKANTIQSEWGTQNTAYCAKKENGQKWF